MDDIRKTHSKSRLTVHLIFVTKYRVPLMFRYGAEVKELCSDISENFGFTVQEMEVDVDPIHLMVEYPPTTSVLEMVRWLKQLSTYRIWRQNNNHIHLSTVFWKEKTFWSDGYFAASMGEASKETIADYIKQER